MTHALFRDIDISYLSIRIPEIAFGKRHDPGHITYLSNWCVVILVVETRFKCSKYLLFTRDIQGSKGLGQICV